MGLDAADDDLPAVERGQVLPHLLVGAAAEGQLFESGVCDVVQRVVDQRVGLAQTLCVLLGNGDREVEDARRANKLPRHGQRLFLILDGR